MSNLLTSTDCLDLVGILDAAQSVAARMTRDGYVLPDRYMELRERLINEAKAKP